MRLHLVAPFHTVPTARETHCAFTAKCFRFPEMMGDSLDVIEYANEGSESCAAEKVVMLSAAEFERYYGKTDGKAFVGTKAVIGSGGHTVFSARLLSEMAKRLLPGDIVGHPFGRSHEQLTLQLPDAIHVETGIGYPDYPVTPWRIFESETWRHWHLGKYDGHRLTNTLGSFVVPNYFNADDWPLGTPDPEKPYVAYLARRDSSKGLFALRDVVQRWAKEHPASLLGRRHPLRFHVAGQGADGADWLSFKRSLGKAASLVVDRGVLVGKERAEFLGGAVVTLCLTQFIEPFGGASIESLLCGTPVITADSGAYVENIGPDDGWRARTLSEVITVLESLPAVGPEWQRLPIRERAIRRFGYETIRSTYLWTFDRIQKMHRSGGWAA